MFHQHFQILNASVKETFSILIECDKCVTMFYDVEWWRNNVLMVLSYKMSPKTVKHINN